MKPSAAARSRKNTTPSTESLRLRSSNLIDATLVTAYEADYFKVPLDLDKFEEYSPKQLKETIHQLEADMRHAAKEMKFEQAAEIRDRLKYLRERELQYI